METAATSLQDTRGGTRIQFLFFQSCPNAQAALVMLRETLRTEAIAGDVELVTVETEEAARRYGFVGSPTIRVNGEDICPPPDSAMPTLACRLYRDADGHRLPYPPREALLEALHRASASGQSS